MKHISLFQLQLSKNRCSDVTNIETSELLIILNDKDLIKADEFIGDVRIPIRFILGELKIAQVNVIDSWYKLRPQGSIHLANHLDFPLSQVNEKTKLFDDYFII